MFRFTNPTTDLIVILLIVLLIFGPKRLPGLGKQLGSGIREFKDSITGRHADDDDERDRPQITEASAASPAAASPAPAPHATAPGSSGDAPPAEVGSSSQRQS